MDGIHDMGGMHGFGPVESEADEPVFHEWWEAHAAALSLVTSFAGLRAVGIRRAVESLDPATYLASSYYERWARSLEDALVGAGTLTAAEIDERAATVAVGPTASEATNPGMVRLVHAALDSPCATSGEPVDGRFALGDQVTVRRMAPAAHHRCPRYVRGVTGVVARAGTGWPHPGSDEPEASGCGWDRFRAHLVTAIALLPDDTPYYEAWVAAIEALLADDGLAPPS